MMTTELQETAVIGGIRRVAVVVIIVSFSLAAVLGIIALLSGDWGDTQWKVLTTTLAVGSSSVLTLIVISALQRVTALLTVPAFVAIGCAFLLSLLFIWVISEWAVIDWEWWYESGWLDGLSKALALSWLFAVALAHTVLLLLVVRRDRRGLRVGLALTFAASAVVVGLITWGVLFGPDWSGEWFPRTLGVAAILVALGTVALPVASRLLQRAAAEPAAASGAPDAAQAAPALSAPALSAAVLTELTARAAAEGVTPEQLLRRLLD